MAIVTLDVTGQILHPDLTPATGTVSFQIPIDLNDVVANVTYTPATFTETLDAFGNFTFTGLIATDSPDLAESGAWMYRVHVLTDAYAESFSTSLPMALGPVAQFADLIPATTEPCTDDGTPCATVAQFADLQAQIDAIGAAGVTSVNGEVGVVILDAADVGADPAGSAAAAQAAAIASSLQKAANLSDVANVAASRTNLGLGGAAVLNVGAIAGTVAAGDDPRFPTSTPLLAANDLSDLANAAAARANLGLSNVDNTSDANKPVSTATQTALNLKADDNLVVHLAGVESITGVKTFTADPVFNAGGIAQASVANLTSDLALKADESITLTAGVGLTGGGDLSANRTFDADLGTTATTLAEGRAPWFMNSPLPISGRYIYTTYGATGTVVPALDSARYTPFAVWRGFTATSIAVEVTTLQATSVVRLGLYSDLNGLPDALITDFGTVSAASTGVKTISPGGGIVFADRTMYWLVAVVQVAGGTTALRTANYHDPMILPSSDGVTNASINSYVQAGVSGALGTPAVPGDASGGPRFMLLIA
jgi:hypothetical protein